VYSTSAALSDTKPLTTCVPTGAFARRGVAGEQFWFLLQHHQQNNNTSIEIGEWR